MEEQISRLEAFTRAPREHCRSAWLACDGDLHAASGRLLSAGGCEMVCFVIPDGCEEGDTITVRTPRGLVDVQVPDGFEGGDTLSFDLPRAEEPPMSISSPTPGHYGERSDDLPLAKAVLEDPEVSTAHGIPQAVATPIGATETGATPGIGARDTSDAVIVRVVATRGYRYDYVYEPYYDPFVPLLGGVLLGGLLCM